MAANEPVRPVQLLPAAHPEEEHEQLGHEEAKHEVRGKRLDFARLLGSSPSFLLGSSGTCAAAGESRRLPGTSTPPSRSRRTRGHCAGDARSVGKKGVTGKPERE